MMFISIRKDTRSIFDDCKYVASSYRIFMALALSCTVLRDYRIWLRLRSWERSAVSGFDEFELEIIRLYCMFIELPHPACYYERL